MKKQDYFIRVYLLEEHKVLSTSMCSKFEGFLKTQQVDSPRATKVINIGNTNHNIRYICGDEAGYVNYMNHPLKLRA